MKRRFHVFRLGPGIQDWSFLLRALAGQEGFQLWYTRHRRTGGAMSAETVGGPYIRVATLCERVLQEQDGVLTVVRVIDRFTITASGPGAPQEMPPSNVSFSIVVMLQSGGVRGRYNLRIVPVTPSGKSLRELSAGVFLEGEDRGVNVVLNSQLAAQEEGLYWFDVFLEEQLLTRIPLRLLYQRVSQGLPPETA